MINNPKDFYQQVQNLCEELGLKMKALTESIASLLSKSDAESTYLKKTDAASTYLGKTAKAESAKTADTATSATSATKATQDGNGAVISSTYLKTATASSTYLTKSDAATTYLGKDAKAQSATFADSATTATSANSALKATQDGDGNVISGTYLKNADAETTYLKKTAKAASATTADSATKATQDGSGNNIANTYATKTDLSAVSTVASNADNKAGQRIAMNGARGTLAGYNTPNVTASAVTINADSNEDTQVTGAVTVTIANGSASTSWLKVVSLTNASATIALGSAWAWANGEIPEVAANAVVTCYWNNNHGLATLVKGEG